MELGTKEQLRSTLEEVNLLELRISNRVYIGVNKGKTAILANDGQKISIDLKIENETEAEEEILSILSKCHSIRKIEWANLEVNDKIIKHLLKVDIGEMNITDNQICVSPPLFLQFLNRNEDKVSLCRVEISNQNITDQNLKLLKDVQISSPWKRDRRSFEDRVTTLTDQCLQSVKQKREFNLSCFLTGITIQGIAEFAKTHNGRYTFGTLGCDQLEAAIAFEKKNRTVQNNVQLRSLNGQIYITFYVYKYDSFERPLSEDEDEPWVNPIICFNISLSETVSGCGHEVSIPEDLVSLRSYEIMKAFNSQSLVETNNIEKHHFDRVSYEYLAGSKCLIKFWLLAEDSIGGFITVTDISKKESFLLFTEFLKQCRSIELLDCFALELDEEIYRVLKPIAIGIDHPYTWDISKIELGPDSFLELINTKSGLFEELEKTRSLSPAMLTNEILSILIRMGIPVITDYMFNRRPHLRPMISDDILDQLASMGNYVPEVFLIEKNITKFTAKGIRTLIKVLISVVTITPVIRYHLGMIEEANLEGMRELVRELEDTDRLSVTTKSVEENCDIVIKHFDVEAAQDEQRQWSIIFSVPIPQGEFNLLAR